MTGDAWFELISASVDGELTADEQELLDRHLDGHPADRAVHRQLEALRRTALVHAAEPIPDLSAVILANRPECDRPLSPATATSSTTAGTASIAAGRTAPRRRWRRTVTAALAGAAACLAAALAIVQPWSSVRSPSDASVAHVAVSDSSFDHTELHVTAGTTVTWTNESRTVHQLVHELPGSSVDGPLAPNDERAVTIDEPGVYQFWCEIHGMRGTLNVVDG